MFNFYIRKILVFISIFSILSFNAYSAVTLDRTRVIFPGNEKSVNVAIKNGNPVEAYLAQSWIEDINGNKLTQCAILATPPLQRIEANSNSLVRLSVTPELNKLPLDRETVFYFNLREVPPRSKESNILQIALQSRVKLFYRPQSILSESETKWAHKVTLTKIKSGYRLNNTTPFYLTVIGFGNSKSNSERGQFEPFMVAPKSMHDISSTALSTPYMTYINDYGGKPTMYFHCLDDKCSVSGE